VPRFRLKTEKVRHVSRPRYLKQAGGQKSNFPLKYHQWVGSRPTHPADETPLEVFGRKNYGNFFCRMNNNGGIIKNKALSEIAILSYNDRLLTG
jgi:hypothetical protein